MSQADSNKPPRIKKYQVLFRVYKNGEVFAVLPKFSRGEQVFCRFRHNNTRMLHANVLNITKPATSEQAAWLRREIKDHLARLAEPYRLEVLTEWPNANGAN